MEKMLVVAFENEAKAYEGARSLNQLDAEGSITIHSESVIRKNSDGTVSVLKTEDDFPVQTIGGTAIGSLIGALGGPVGFGIGAIVGSFAGLLGDIYAAGVNTDFGADVAAILTPGKCAIVADVSEEWVTPVDSRMEPLGGVVFRSATSAVEDELRARDVAEIKQEIEQMKVEHARASADRKAKLHAKIDSLTAKLQAKLQQAQERSEQIKAETEAKIQALQKRAAKAQGDTRKVLDDRAAQIRADYERRSKHLKSLAAEQLRKAAAQIEN